MEKVITKELSKSGDASERQQQFKNLHINILCCRYWAFEIWKGQKMAFPFWRFYWNKNEGAYVFFEKTVYLQPDSIYLIAPNTPFSNGIRDQQLAGDPAYFFKCGEIELEEEEQRHESKGDILHFFTHFTLGYPYSEAKPGVYPLPLTLERKALLERIIRGQFEESTDFSMSTSLAIYHLLVSTLSALPYQIWLPRKADPRILKTLDYIQQNLDTKITRETLAEQLFMTPGAFSRLFQKYTGKTPSKYLLALRLEQASNLLLHTHSSIESIAQQCGFVDRYHLTKVFSKTYQLSPAAFRKGVGYF